MDHAKNQRRLMMKEENQIYCTVKQIVADEAFCFTKGMLRYYLLNAHKNGLKKAIRKVGRKVLIRRDLFIQWIEAQTRR